MKKFDFRGLPGFNGDEVKKLIESNGRPQSPDSSLFDAQTNSRREVKNFYNS